MISPTIINLETALGSLQFTHPILTVPCPRDDLDLIILVVLSFTNIRARRILPQCDDHNWVSYRSAFGMFIDAPQDVVKGSEESSDENVYRHPLRNRSGLIAESPLKSGVIV